MDGGDYKSLSDESIGIIPRSLLEIFSFIENCKTSQVNMVNYQPYPQSNSNLYSKILALFSLSLFFSLQLLFWFFFSAILTELLWSTNSRTSWCDAHSYKSTMKWSLTCLATSIYHCRFAKTNEEESMSKICRNGPFVLRKTYLRWWQKVIN